MKKVLFITFQLSPSIKRHLLKASTAILSDDNSGPVVKIRTPKTETLDGGPIFNNQGTTMKRIRLQMKLQIESAIEGHPREDLNSNEEKHEGEPKTEAKKAIDEESSVDADMCSNMKVKVESPKGLKVLVDEGMKKSLFIAFQLLPSAKRHLLKASTPQLSDDNSGTGREKPKKKQRRVWTLDLHKKFRNAMEALGGPLVCKDCIYNKISEENLHNCPVCNADLGSQPLRKLRCVASIWTMKTFCSVMDEMLRITDTVLIHRLLIFIKVTGSVPKYAPLYRLPPLEQLARECIRFSRWQR